MHRILESLDALGQTVDDFVLLVESLVHLILKSLSESHELSHCLLLEFFDVLVLHFKLLVAIIFELAHGKGFVCPFVIYFFVQLVLLVIDLLHDVLFSLDSGLYFSIESVLES